jgi:hypothetical protein
MGFYELSKPARARLTQAIHNEILQDFKTKRTDHISDYFADADTYIRKAAYLATGRIYQAESGLRRHMLTVLAELFKRGNEKVRQTVINSAGEIGMSDFEKIEGLMENGLFDAHHSVRNAVIGSVKKMGEKNPAPVLAFARKYLHHSDK